MVYWVFFALGVYLVNKSTSKKNNWSNFKKWVVNILVGIISGFVGILLCFSTLNISSQPAQKAYENPIINSTPIAVKITPTKSILQNTPSSTPSGRWVCVSSNVLNIRTEPSLDASISGSLTRDKCTEFSEISDNGQWLHIKEGWIFRAYTHPWVAETVSPFGGYAATQYAQFETPITGCPDGCAVKQTECDIKGNVSFNSGEKIYHVPGQEYYDETVINPGYGEKWFCTEQEAIDAGWRRSER